MNWIANNSSSLMVIITAIYVIATVVICIFNGKSAKAASKQIEEMKNQQKQNVGIQLYNIRKNVLTQFQKKEYNAIYWDSEMLFSKNVSADIKSAEHLYERVKEKKWLIEEYEERLKIDMPDVYEQYQTISSSLNEHLNDDNIKTELFKLCKTYQPIYNGPITTEEIILDYENLYNELCDLKQKHDMLHTRTFLEIHDEIEKSIN